MTLQQFRYLAEIARHHSISKAAAALYVTQPGLSKAVRELEDELGITILDRTNKGVVFTADGAELLSYANRVLEQMNFISYHFHEGRSQEKLKISLASQYYDSAVAAMVRLTEALQDKSYELSFSEGKTTDVIDAVCSGRSIAGIVSLSDFNKQLVQRYFQSRSLTFTVLASVRAHVFLRASHPLAGCDRISLTRLQDYPCLTYQQQDTLLQFSEKEINIEGARQVIYVQDRGTMNNLLAHTDGYNLGTGCLVAGYMEGSIVSRPLAEVHTIQIGLVKRGDAFWPPEIELYAGYFKESLHQSLPASAEFP